MMIIFKQKTSYERRINDWSSDVCSSDLSGRARLCAGEGCNGARDRTASDPDRRCPCERGDAARGGANIAAGRSGAGVGRSAVRREGKECVCKFRSRWSPYHYKQMYISLHSSESHDIMCIIG